MEEDNLVERLNCLKEGIRRDVSEQGLPNPNEVLRGHLWVTGYHEALQMYPKMSAILSMGPDLTEDIPHLTSFAHKRINIKDTNDTDLLQYLDECTDFIHLHKTGRVLVHCQAGASRSVAVVAAYLMRYHYLSLSQAMSCIRDARPLAWPNEGFMHQLQMYCSFQPMASKVSSNGSKQVCNGTPCQ